MSKFGNSWTFDSNARMILDDYLNSLMSEKAPKFLILDLNGNYKQHGSARGRKSDKSHETGRRHAPAHEALTSN